MATKKKPPVKKAPETKRVQSRIQQLRLLGFAIGEMDKVYELQKFSISIHEIETFTDAQFTSYVAKVQTELAKKPVQETQEEKKEIQVVERIIMKEFETQDGMGKLSPAQVQLMKRTIAKDATDDELSMFIQICMSSKLNPFLRQIHFVKRWDKNAGKEVGAVQVGIDGLRSIADRTEAYVGSEEPVYTGEIVDREWKTDKANGKYNAPEKCVVIVKKVVKGFVGTFAGEARWDELYPGDKQGFMWRKMPHVMLGKCAEAQALRKAFPSQMSGLYVQEELDGMNASAAEEKRVQQQFEQAQKMIYGVKDKKALTDMKKKITASDKYNQEQKDKLSEIVDIQLAKVEKPKDTK